jgi:O-antigen ligase
VAWPRKALIGGAAVLAVVVIGGFALPQTRHVLAASPNKLSSSRLDLARRGGDAFRRHPLRGVGLGGYSVAASKTGTRRSRLAPHDLTVEAASEQGLLGLGALLAFGVVVVRAVRAPRATAAQRAIRTVLAIELGALTVHSLAYDTFFADPLVWALAALLAVGATRVATPEAEPAAETVEPRAVPA